MARVLADLTRPFMDAAAIKIGNFGSVVIASSDTDIFDLEELWFVSGRGNSGTFFPLHDLANDLDSGLAEVLPAINVLTG